MYSTPNQSVGVYTIHRVHRQAAPALDQQQVKRLRVLAGEAVTALAQPTAIATAATPVEPILPATAPADPLHRKAACYA